MHSCLLGLACPVGPPGLTSRTQALRKHKEPQNLLSLTSQYLMIIYPFLWEHYRRTRHSQSTGWMRRKQALLSLRDPGTGVGPRRLRAEALNIIKKSLAASFH